MSWHGMSAWVAFGLATLPFLTMRVLQVRFHDDIDGSSLARAIYASTGPLLLPFDSGFPTHTLTHIHANYPHRVCMFIHYIMYIYNHIYIYTQCTTSTRTFSLFSTKRNIPLGACEMYGTLTAMYFSTMLSNCPYKVQDITWQHQVWARCRGDCSRCTVGRPHKDRNA